MVFELSIISRFPTISVAKIAQNNLKSCSTLFPGPFPSLTPKPGKRPWERGWSFVYSEQKGKNAEFGLNRVRVLGSGSQSPTRFFPGVLLRQGIENCAYFGEPGPQRQISWIFSWNRPRSIYQYSSMAPRLSDQNCKFFKFLLSLNSQKRLRYKESNTKYRSLTWKPRSHVRILIYRTWPIDRWHYIFSFGRFLDRFCALNGFSRLTKFESKI